MATECNGDMAERWQTFETNHPNKPHSRGTNPKEKHPPEAFSSMFSVLRTEPGPVGSQQNPLSLCSLLLLVNDVSRVCLRQTWRFWMSLVFEEDLSEPATEGCIHCRSGELTPAFL